jgi:hypothetical protein
VGEKLTPILQITAERAIIKPCEFTGAITGEFLVSRLGFEVIVCLFIHTGVKIVVYSLNANRVSMTRR